MNECVWTLTGLAELVCVAHDVFVVAASKLGFFSLQRSRCVEISRHLHESNGGPYRAGHGHLGAFSKMWRLGPRFIEISIYPALMLLIKLN